MDTQSQTLQLSPNPDAHHHHRVLLYGVGAILLLIIGTGIGFLLATHDSTIQNQLVTTLPHQKTSPTIIPTPSITPSANSDWKTYTNRTYNYSLQYPATWTADEAKPGAAHQYGNTLFSDELQKVEFINEDGYGTPNPVTDYPTQVLLTVLPNTANQTLDTWAKSYEADGVGHNVHLFPFTENTELGGLPAKKANNIFEGDHGQDEIAVMKDNKIFIISYDGSNPNDPSFQAHSQIYQHMIDSFMFLK